MSLKPFMIPDIDKVYKKLDLKKFTLNYNKAKIKNSPTDFKLKSRVIINKELTNSYSRRFSLLSHIIGKTPFQYSMIGVPGFLSVAEYAALKSKHIDIIDKELCDFTPSCFNMDEDLKISLDVLLGYTLNYFEIQKSGYSGKDFYGDTTIKRLEYLFEKYVPVLDFLTTENSIAKELFLSAFTFVHGSFNDLRELQDVKEILDNKIVTASIPIMHETEAFVFCPMPKFGKSSISNPFGKNNVVGVDLHIKNTDFLIDVEIRRAYALGLEIMYYFYNNQNDIFEAFFDESSEVFKDVVLKAEAAGVFLEHNPSERFSRILTLINYHTFTDVIKDYNSDKLYVPIALHNLIEFAQVFAYMAYQINLSLLLIDYCNKNKIKIRDTVKDPGVVSSDEDNEDEDEDEEDEDSWNDEDEYTSVEYDDISKPSSKKSKREHKTKASEIDPAILDKAMARFETNLYKFDVESKYTHSPTKAEIDEYNKIADASKMITSLLVKEIKNIKCYNFGGKNSGKISGKLDNKRLYLYKSQKNIFYDNTYKTKEMDPVFGIVLDQSGSMCGKGIEDGKITMILLHEVLKSLGVNHSIIGHTSNGYRHSKIFKYVAFKEDKGYTLNKAYNLVNLDAYYGNCDSGALYYMEQQLLRTKQKDKICIIFSDGQPTECSKAELIDQVYKMESEGIRVIGVGINFESIKNYYPNNANGRNLKEMLDIVCNLLKQFVLEKED